MFHAFPWCKSHDKSPAGRHSRLHGFAAQRGAAHRAALNVVCNWIHPDGSVLVLRIWWDVRGIWWEISCDSRGKEGFDANLLGNSWDLMCLKRDLMGMSWDETGYNGDIANYAIWFPNLGNSWNPGTSLLQETCRYITKISRFHQCKHGSKHFSKQQKSWRYWYISWEIRGTEKPSNWLEKTRFTSEKQTCLKPAVRQHGLGRG